jgi:hypothetical protein
MPSWSAGLAAMRAGPRCRARSKRTGNRCQAHVVAGFPVCFWHGAHRDSGPIDNVNRVKSGAWTREELVAVKAASAVGRSVRAIARNALARVEGTITNDEGAAESDRLWGEIAEAQATQIEAREEKARRLGRKRPSAKA